ncbi:MAG: carbohydrate kinase family protein [Actinobacteria bacterium]|nr:carbohydrate kinase family protein [Actinomycetota bacterium]
MDEKKFDVIGIGSCILDTVAFVSKFTEKEEKINATGYVPPKAAGVSLDAITQTAYLGMECGFIGKRGDDAMGDIFHKEMSSDNIDLSRAIVVKNERTPIAWIQVIPSGERCHVIMPMSKRGFLTKEEIHERQDYIKNSRAVHLELLLMPVKPLIEAAKICNNNEVLVSVDLDISPRYLYEYGYANEKELLTLFSKTDILKACKNAVSDLTDKKDMRNAAVDIMKFGSKIVVITTGEEGCVVAFKEDGKIRSIEVPAFNVNKEIKDTTGAGDSFQGAFLFGILKDYPIEKAAVLANACAFLKTLRIGARNMPRRKEVESFLKDYGWKGL